MRWWAEYVYVIAGLELKGGFSITKIDRLCIESVFYCTCCLKA